MNSFIAEVRIIQKPVYGAVVIATEQPHSTKPELRFYAGSNPASGMSETRDGENL